MRAVRGNRGDAGFTLVELLVVIAILAMLISILMPVLGRAREITRQVLCGTQLRSHGTAYRLYAEDNDNWIVSTCFGNYRSDETGYYVTPSTHVRERMLRYLDEGSPEGRYHEIFLCPTQVTFETESRFAWDSLMWSRLFSSSKCHLYVRRFGTPYSSPERVQPVFFQYPGHPPGTTVYRRKFVDLPHPGKTIAEGDSASSIFGGLDPDQSYATPSYRHVGESLNLLCADGHVAKFTMKMWEDGDDTKYFWNHYD